MEDVHDMKDRDMDVAIAEKVMGLQVAGWWPVTWEMSPFSPLYIHAKLVPLRFVNPDEMPVDEWRENYIDEIKPFSLQPFLIGPHRAALGEIVPEYTTDARETEKVMSRMVDLRWEVFISFRYSCEKSVQMIPNVWYEGREDCPDIDVHARDLKRAVCEAALLAVRGAAQ